MRGIKGKRFIVAGGAIGIGEGLVARLVSEGAIIVVADINETALRVSVTKHKGPGKAIAMPFDIADEASVKALVKRAADELGGLDGLASTVADLSAATMGKDIDVPTMQTKIWERTLQVNVTGHGVLMREVIPHLEARGGGPIVVTSSAAAFFGWPDMPAYAISKAGLHALVRSVAKRCGKQNIRCNGVASGLVLTEGGKVNLKPEVHDQVLNAIAMPRLGEVDDLASALMFFLSDESAWITGQVLSVNGGLAFRD